MKIILDKNAMMEKIFDTVRMFQIDENFKNLRAEFHVMSDGGFFVHILPKGSCTDANSLACVSIEYNNDQSDEVYDEYGNRVFDIQWNPIYSDVLCEYIDSERNRIMLNLENQLDYMGYEIEWKVVVYR